MLAVVLLVLAPRAALSSSSGRPVNHDEVDDLQNTVHAPSPAVTTFVSVGLVNSAILWPNGQKAFRSDPSALSFPHPTGDPDRAVALVYSSDGGASTNDGGRSWQTIGKFGRLSPTKTVGQDMALDGKTKSPAASVIGRAPDLVLLEHLQQ